jgi:ribonuclease J
MTDETLKIIPLGGLGEVGMNCLVYEYADEAIMVDCGVMFHDEDLGVDIVHPSFDYVFHNSNRLRGLVLTHGHEDHIGAVPFLIRGLNVPIYGSRLALHIVESKLRELRTGREIKTTNLEADSELTIGPFRIKTAAVNHSIPQTYALFIQTPAGNVLHASDFKFGSPGDTDRLDRERFAAFREQGIDLLLSDSTNIEKEGHAGEEATVTRCLRAIMEQAPSRAFMTLFPSNIRRIGAVMQLAAELERSVVLVGRSMEGYYRAARDLDLISTEGIPFVQPSALKDLENRQILFLVAGTQGEPRSALSKIARREHSKIKIEPDDTVIYSSRHIPGNGMDISRIMNFISRQGAKIYHIGNTSDIHVSGHGHRQDLEDMISMTAPSHFMPIHGNYFYLKQHADLASSLGVPGVQVIENGEVAQFSRQSGLAVAGSVPAGKVHVDGLMEVDEGALDARRSISEGGLVSAIVVLRRREGETSASVRLISHGVLERSRFSDIEDAARESAEMKLGELVRTGRLIQESIEKDVRRSIEKYFSKYYKRHPMVAVEVVELDD